MGDKFRAKISVTPIVSLAADADGDAADVIHHDIQKTIGGRMSFDTSNLSATGTWRWFYAPKVAVFEGDGDVDIIRSANGTYTDGTVVSSSDKPRVVYLEHLNIDATTNLTSNANDRVSITPDGDNFADNMRLELEPGDCIVLKYKQGGSVLNGSLHVDMDQNSCYMKVLAIVDDVG
tara:strand:+ start:610 stop:1140 length:531 start_codon:yes stop_codon:yes gene_type:complete